MLREWRRGTTSPQPIKLPWVEVNKSSDHRIKVGDVVELAESSRDMRDGDFLLILTILRNLENDEVRVRGPRMKRCKSKSYFGMLPRKRNELCIEFPAKKDDDHRGLSDQALEDVSIENLQQSVNGKPLKRDVIFTNLAYPAKSFRDANEQHGVDEASDQAYTESTLDKIIKQGLLVCRWVWTRYSDQGKSSGDLPYHQSIRRLRQEECDVGQSVPDQLLSMDWHNHIPDVSGVLTYGDGFCGCGGFTQGAKDAKYKVLWGFDAESKAIASWILNNPDADGWTATVDNFLGLNDVAYVDVLHISPPCQAFSQANTLAGRRDPGSAAGQHDEANSAASFCVQLLLQKVRPRVVTMEQTSSVLTHRGEYFRGIIAQFTDAGYSVQWKLVDFAAYGLPQHRKRLIMIASCPGGVIPSMPQPSHGGPGTGLLRHTTIGDCVRRVGRRNKYHDAPDNENPLGNAGDYLLTQLVATSGTAEYHPHGRKFTIAELLELMLFPSESFQFGEGQTAQDMRRQIGNAVPPRVARTILRSIRHALRQEDMERLDADRERSVTVGAAESGHVDVREVEGSSWLSAIDLTVD